MDRCRNVVNSCLVALFLLLFMSPVSAAPGKLISNSADWHDVYSTMLFGSIQGVSTSFLTSARHSTILLYSIEKNLEVEIVSSKRNAFVSGYESILEGRGYDGVTEVLYDNVNLGLAQNLEGITNFIVIDPAYGYNAISVAPYAALTKSYVLFADSRTIGAVKRFLDSRKVDKLLLFGQVDRVVKEELASFSPEIINEGDRFDNNIAIVKKYQAIGHKKQALLSNGEFIEQSLMSGNEPVLFIGRTNVPDQTRKYISDSEIEVGVLVGNELIGSATFIRRQLGISVFVKFAQGSRTPSGSIAPVEDLDRFPMPSFNLGLDIVSAAYNKGTQSLEVTFHNLVDVATYFKSTISIADGTGTKTTGDQETLFIGGGEYKTVVYKTLIDGTPLMLTSEGASARVFTVFGEARKSLEFTVEKTLNIESVTILDSADIEIVDLVYNNRRDQFEVKISSTGQADAYVSVELVDVFINDEPVRLASEGAVLVKKGSSQWIPIKGILVDEDILANPQVLVEAYYGERENALVKVKTKSFAFKEKGIDYVTYLLVIVVIILLFLFLFTRKKRCGKCRAKNKRNATHCIKCGHPLKESHHGHQGGHHGGHQGGHQGQ